VQLTLCRVPQALGKAPDCSSVRVTIVASAHTFFSKTKLGVKPLVYKKQLCQGIEFARESNVPGNKQVWQGINKRGRHRSYGELRKPTISEFVSYNLSPINNINNPSC
jgi:hypothetical protein